MNHLYRYEGQLYSKGVDEWENSLGSYSEVKLREYPIVRTTKCGTWIDVYGLEKFVRLTARKKFACPTIEEAKESFILRKKRQIKILKSRLKIARIELELIQKGGSK